MKVYVVCVSRCLEGSFVNEYAGIFENKQNAEKFVNKLNKENEYPEKQKAEYYIEEEELK